MRLLFSFTILFFFLQNINAQYIYVDKNPSYNSLGNIYSLDSVAYGHSTTVFFVKIKPQKGQLLTFSGAYTSSTWNLVNTNNHLQTFSLQYVQNMKKKGYLINEKKRLNATEQYYEEADADNYTAEFVYEKIPESVEKVDIIQGLVFDKTKIKLSNILLISKYGKKVVIAENNDDSLKINTDKIELLLNDIVKLQNKGQFNQSLKKIELAISKLDTIKNKSDYSTLLLNKANSLYYIGDWRSAINEYRHSLQITQENTKTENKGILYNNLAAIYASRLMQDEALNYYGKALAYYTNKNMKQEQAHINYNIGNLYYLSDDYDNALKYYNSTLDIENKLNNKKEKLLSYNNIGVIYYKKRRWGAALQNYFQSLDLAKKYNKKQEEAITLNNIGNVKFDEQQYLQAVDYYNRSRKLSSELRYLKGLAIALHNEANAYLKLNKADTARLLLSQSLQIAQKLDLKEIIYSNYKSLAEIYAEVEGCKKSLNYYKKYAELRFSVSEEKVNQISILHQKYVNTTQNLEQNYTLKIKQLSKEKLLVSKKLSKMIGQLKAERLIARYHKEKQNQKIELLNKQNIINQLTVREKEQDLKTKKWQLLALGGVLLLGVLLIILLIRSNKQTKKSNKLLEEKNKAIIKQKEQIEKQKNKLEIHSNLIAEQKEAITDSIVYARRIQQAVLPPTSYFNEFLPENFVFYRPRDIVSGDFYWINQQKNKIIVAAGDCTGHGVPGAFLSMLGISFLNRIVGEQEIEKASDILDKLRDLFISSLHQTGKMNEAKDGMDISLVIIDIDKKEIDYAGAYNSLYLVSDQKTYLSDRQELLNGRYLHEWKADKMPISIYSGKIHAFTNHKIKYSNSDSLYLFSDGFVDQFGGADGRKYLSKKFKKFLLQIAHKAMAEQQILIQREFDGWRGKYSQIDDVIIIGFKLL